MRSTVEVITAGETMVLGTPAQPGRLRHAQSLELKIGGAESNLAIALSPPWRLRRMGELSEGRRARPTRPGSYPGEGVDVSQVRRLEGPTGLYLRERLATGQVYYYRRGSAASTMGLDAFDPEYLEGARFLHLTGITSALSDECRAFTSWAAREARRVGVRVSFDVNYRSKLWSPESAKGFVEELLPEVDLLFVGDEEARALWERDDEEFARELAEKGPQEVVLKRGGDGSMLLFEGRLLEQPNFDVPEVDPVGAGDAFNAGYLAGHTCGSGDRRSAATRQRDGRHERRDFGRLRVCRTKKLRNFLEGKEALGEMSGNMRERPKERQECRG